MVQWTQVGECSTTHPFAISSREPALFAGESVHFSGWVQMQVDAAGISRAFDGLGRVTARWPYTVLAVSILFTVGCGLCYLFLFEQELDNEDLYTPSNAQSFKDMDFVVDTFGEPGEEVATRSRQYPPANYAIEGTLCM